MEFTSPFSRIEAILQNILGADNVLEDPLSRTEVILLAILNDTEITEEFNYDELSELEALLYAIKESDEEYATIPETRSGKILLKILHGEKYEGETVSRVEELLKEWSHAAAWYTKTIGPSNPINVSDALAEPAVGLKVDLSPIQESSPWIDTVANTTPYLLRPTETSGNTADEKLVGGSVVWNQVVGDPNFTGGWWLAAANTTVTYSNNIAEVTVNEGATSNYFLQKNNVSFYKNHKYFISYDAKADSNGSTSTGGMFTFATGYSAAFTFNHALTDNWARYSTIVNSSIDVTGYLRIGFKNPDISGQFKYYLRTAMLIDLTQMFANNPAIADYAYTLETSEAGSGIAWLKAQGFFNKIYYPYNPGEIMSMKVFSKKVVGFNQWDEVVEKGYYNVNTGLPVGSQTQIRAKNPIPIFGGYEYYCFIENNLGIWALFYDQDGSAIDQTVSTTTAGKASLINGRTFVTPSNAKWMRFYFVTNYGTTYKNDTCINLSDPNRNGEYEPYKEQIYELGNDELRGLFKLDTTTNKLYTDGDVKTSDGVINRKYDIVDLGSLTYTKAAGFTTKDCFYTSINSLPSVPDRSSARIPNAISTKFLPTYQNASVWDINTFVITVGVGVLPANSLGFIVSLNTYQDASEFKTAMSGQYLVYEKTIPTTESSTPFTNPQDVYAGGTEEFVDERTVPIPAGHETIYSNVQEITGYDEVVITHGTDESDPNPTEYSISFQSMGTVYSGSLDVLNGRLTIDMAEVDLGALNWTYYTSATYPYFTSTGIQSLVKKPASNAEKANVICNKYETSNANQPYLGAITNVTGVFASGSIFVYDTRYTNATTFKSAMDGVQLVYELATPITYNLTPTEVEMLLNSNYLKSNGGVMTLTYKGTNPAILLMNKFKTKALMRKSKELQNGNLQPVLPAPSRKL